MQCCNALARQHSAAWILEGDIRGCFDNISHEWLLKNIPLNRVVLRQLRIPANVTGHSGDRDRFAHGLHAGTGFVL